MKVRIKSILVISFVAGCAMLFPTASTHSGGAEAATEAAASPRSLYAQNCARCHGVDGRAQTETGKKLEAADLTSGDVKASSTAKISRAIRNGRPDMPAFGKRLTSKQIASIASYVKSL